MNIENVEIRNQNRVVIGILDDFNSLIWHSVWFGVGDFEIYAKVSETHLGMLQVGNYITRDGEQEIGVIEAIEISTSIQDGKMITARGRFAKSFLDRRLIYMLSGKTNFPTVLRGRVENAVRTLVQNNAINCTFDSSRNIDIIELGLNKNIPAIIVDANGHAAEKQVSYQNLMEYTDKVLQEYGLSSLMLLDPDTLKLQYVVREGTDRSTSNTDGNEAVIFSKDFDNLADSLYSYDKTNYKNVALIGGEGEGKERFYSLLDTTHVEGIARKEVFVDSSDLNKQLARNDLAELFPTGVFSGLNFLVDSVVYATFVSDGNTTDYSLDTLEDKFPTGQVSGKNFVVNSQVYATEIYGEDVRYKLTPIGYKAMQNLDEQETTWELTDDRYKIMLDTKGKQELSTMITEESFSGSIVVTAGNYILNEDFSLGDIVTVQENSINKYIDVRITEVTEVQDENGYTVDVVYE